MFETEAGLKDVLYLNRVADQYFRHPTNLGFTIAIKLEVAKLNKMGMFLFVRLPS